MLGQSGAAPGDQISGTLTITNSGNPLDLTALAHPFRGPAVFHCRPAFQVYLTNGAVTNEGGFLADCSSRPFIIRHGANHLPFRLSTSYAACSQAGGSAPTSGIPPCTAQGTPPLPSGSYKAELAWSESVPLPSPKPVTVEVAYACGATPCAPPATPVESAYAWLNAVNAKDTTLASSFFAQPRAMAWSDGHTEDWPTFSSIRCVPLSDRAANQTDVLCTFNEAGPPGTQLDGFWTITFRLQANGQWLITNYGTG